MDCKQGKKRIGIGLPILLFLILGVANSRVPACDIDLTALIEAETASSPAAVPWVKAAHAVSSLSDALNAGTPSTEVVYCWDHASMDLLASCGMEDAFRTEISSVSQRIRELLNSENYIGAHEILQRQFRLVLQGLARLEIPFRAFALADLAGRTWSLVEAARDRDKRRFRTEITGLASSAITLETGWSFPENSPVESVRHWVRELARVSPGDDDAWPDELLLAVSQLKNSLIQLHKFIRTDLPGK